MSEISGAGVRDREGDFFLAAGAGSDSAGAGTVDRGLTVSAEAFLTGFFSARSPALALAGAAVFWGVTTVLPVNVFETPMDDAFFAEMGDGFTFITKKSLL
ncbi:MAG TPA: hypothetical protein VNN22_00700 [Verrucomicrobiae bacterium]|nr:hypothetical protein [Verrucomicrobiae bacterium]